MYLLVLPSDVQLLENDPVSKAQYEQLRADSQEVLERFLNDSGIVLNEKCPDSRVFSAEKMLQEELPEYAVPEKINIIKNMPVTESGKIDYRKLKNYEE